MATAATTATNFVTACPHKRVSSTISFWTKGWEEPIVLCESCYFYHVSSSALPSSSISFSNNHRKNRPLHKHNPNSSSVECFFSDVHASIASVWCRSQRLKKERSIVRSIKQCDYYEQPNCIIPGKLYLGSQFSACHLETLRRLNITAVLVCGNSLPRFFMEHKNSAIAYHKLPIHDSVDQPLLPYIHSAMQFLDVHIHEQHQCVLVHCAAGVSRSASMVIAFLMKEHGWDYDTARHFVWEKRPTINPNPRFEQELRCRWYPLCAPANNNDDDPNNDRSNSTNYNHNCSIADGVDKYDTPYHSLLLPYTSSTTTDGDDGKCELSTYHHHNDTKDILKKELSAELCEEEDDEDVNTTTDSSSTTSSSSGNNDHGDNCISGNNCD